MAAIEGDYQRSNQETPWALLDCFGRQDSRCQWSIGTGRVLLTDRPTVVAVGGLGRSFCRIFVVWPCGGSAATIGNPTYSPHRLSLVNVLHVDSVN